MMKLGWVYGIFARGVKKCIRMALLIYEEPLFIRST